MKGFCVIVILLIISPCILARAKTPVPLKDQTNIDRMVAGITELRKIPQFRALLDEHDESFRKIYEEDGKSWKPEPIYENQDGTDALRCETMSPSSEIPTSVHFLRPADVNVMGAIGDSLTAANGAGAWTVITVLREYRGKSFSVGGDRQYDAVITLPNFIREFNGGVYGQSTGVSGVDKVKEARFNLAEPGHESAGMPRQAQRLVDRMKEDPTVDMENDWKIITLFVGGNDMCTYCEDREFYSPANFKLNIQEALDIFHTQMPRTFVNVLPLFDMTGLADLSNSLTCGIVHLFICPCKPKTDAEIAEVAEWSREYQVAVEELIESGRYDTKDDFTVVVQPFFKNTYPPRKDNGKYDYSYWAPDCFHFSTKGHGAAAEALWNSMLEPVGAKREEWMLGSPIKCTTMEQPYLATGKNSGNGAFFARGVEEKVKEEIIQED